MTETLFDNHRSSEIRKIHIASPNRGSKVAMKTSDKTSHTYSTMDSTLTQDSNDRSENAASLNTYLSPDEKSNGNDDSLGSLHRDSSRFARRRSSKSSASGKAKRSGGLEEDENGRHRRSSCSPRSRRKKDVASTTIDKPKRRGSRNDANELPLNDEEDEIYGEYTLNDEGGKPAGSPDSARSLTRSAKKLFDRTLRAASPGILRRARSGSPGVSKMRSSMRVRQNSGPTDDGNDNASEKRHGSPGRLKKKIGGLDVSRGEQIPSSKVRSQSPGRHRKRSESPGKLRKRVESPGRLKKRAESPGRLKKRPESFSRVKKRSDSPGTLQNRPESPGRLKNRGESPGRLRKRAESPGRIKKRADSPGRLSRSTRSSRRQESATDDKKDDGFLGVMLDRDAEEKPRKREPRSVASAPIRKQTPREGYPRRERSSRSSGVHNSESSTKSSDEIPSIPRRPNEERSEEHDPSKVEQNQSSVENESMKHKVRRNRSLDAGMARAVQKLKNLGVDGGKDEKNGNAGSEQTRPMIRRSASMLLTREMGRRGKQDSLVELVQYKEEEIHSTSYFASNHVLINRERMKRGLRPLSRNIAMDELARKSAEAMAKSNGLNLLPTTYVGNVLRGESIRSIHRSIMLQKNGRERANVLNPYFQDFGVGTWKGEDEQLYMCQLFSERLELALTDTVTNPKEQKGEKGQKEEKEQKEP